MQHSFFFQKRYNRWLEYYVFVKLDVREMGRQRGIVPSSKVYVVVQETNYRSPRTLIGEELWHS